MVSIQTIALVLLLGRIVSVTFMALVLRKQINLLRLPVDKEIRGFRKLLFLLSCIIMVGNVIPIIIDALTLLSDNAVGRNPEVPTISIMYALSNSFTAAISSITLWLLYRTAEKAGEIPDNNK